MIKEKEKEKTLSEWLSRFPALECKRTTKVYHRPKAYNNEKKKKPYSPMPFITPCKIHNSPQQESQITTPLHLHSFL